VTGLILVARKLTHPAGIPAARRLATKPQLTQQMLQRTRGRHAGRWVAGDSVYADDRRLRRWLEGQPQAHMLAVSGQEYVWLGGRQRRVNTLVAGLPIDGWSRLRAGEGRRAHAGMTGGGFSWRLRCLPHGAANL
jgi:hypothetical protein